jgi:hypothetical protein
MKKVIVSLIFLSFFSITHAQFSDTLLRAAGFYISPAITDFHFPKENMAADPQFSGSLGFRFINKLPHGFFIEGGAGIGLFKGNFPAEDLTWQQYIDWGYYVTNHYTQQRTVKEINLMAPFLAGYKTQHGKVRFQGALGIAFCLRNIEFTSIRYLSGTPPPYYYYLQHDDVNASFGTSFMAVARAGISVPVGKRISIDILPTARYRMFYFTNDDRKLSESVKTGENPWMLGLDVGMTFALDNKESEEVYESEEGKPVDEAYTIQYNDGSVVKPVKKKLVNNGPKNFIYLELFGNGISYTHNYERTVFRKGIVNIQARGGCGFFARKYSFPLGANIALGTGRKKFEAGLTVTCNNFNNSRHYEQDDQFNMTIDPSLAFRLESRKHFFLRLAVMTHYFPITGDMLAGAGVSLGGCF